MIVVCIQLLCVLYVYSPRLTPSMSSIPLVSVMHCLEVTAFPLAPLSLEQPLPRIPDVLMGVGGAMSSTFSTSMKICEYFVNSFCSLLDCVLLLHGVYKDTNNLLSEDF